SRGIFSIYRVMCGSIWQVRVLDGKSALGGVERCHLGFSAVIFNKISRLTLMVTSSVLAVDKPHLPRPTFRPILRDLITHDIDDRLVPLIYCASGPIEVILAAAAAGNLSPDQSSSWIFGAFLGNGILTLLMTYRYRSPQAYFWTIPGTVLAGDALMHLSF